MSGTSEPDGPRWRSGPFVYGSVLISLPLLLLVLWAMPAVVPTLIKGHVPITKAAAAVGWGLLVFACPLGALLYRRRYLYSEAWQGPRRASIFLAGAGYVVSIASYVAVAFLAMNRPF